MCRLVSILVLVAALGVAQGQTPVPTPAPAPAALADCLRELEVATHTEARGQDKTDVERLRKQVELQQEQIKTLVKMVRLLAEQVGKAPPAAPVVSSLEARSVQAAQRDQELAQAVSDLTEKVDAAERRGPTLPSTLRELFLPSRTNESPLAIYGTLASNFTAFQDSPSNFPSPSFLPHFYLLLNEQFVMEVNPTFVGTTIELESAQLDWFLTDHLTLVLGRFYSPLGFFNERLHTSWIFKTPDRPLLFHQVFPAQASINGVMLKGATYLCDWPVKLEFSSFVTNGYSLGTGNPTARDFADLRAMSDAFDDVNSDKAYGGRVGLTFPTLGIWMGVSGMVNGAYDRAGMHDLSLWDIDFSWHHGNWDFRFELAQAHQQAPGAPIERMGWYAQIAYRPYDCPHVLLSQLEAVFRFDAVRFRGIDLDQTGLAFGGRENIPIDRNRYTVGLNYYPYPSLIFKVAYEINEELNARSFRDNGFLAQLAWGF